MAITNKKYAYWVEREKIAFVEETSETIGSHTSKWRTIQEDGLTARIYGTKTPESVVTGNLDTELPLPHFVDEAALNFIIASGYEDPRNLQPQAAQMFLAKVNGLLREAKKVFRKRKQSGGFIKPVDF
jgi:hypothetical protein